MISIKKIITLSLLLLIFTSCQNGCNKVKEIEVSSLLINYSKNKNINYCNILSSAIKGNDKSIIKLVKLEIFDAAGYDHGIVIVDLITYIGEDKFINSLPHKLNDKEKGLLAGYLKVGIEYNDKLTQKKLNLVFPKVYDFISK